MNPCISMSIKALIATLIYTLVATPAVASIVDAVLVEKSERKLYLYSGDRVVRAYDVSLGESPVGHKTTEGDEKTPEGTYEINWRNPNSRFHLSIQISYPNEDDLEQARERGVSPGGLIFIHGLPNGRRSLEKRLRGQDWTDGCIAVNSNREMEEIWKLVPVGTPITINP